MSEPTLTIRATRILRPDCPGIELSVPSTIRMGRSLSGHPGSVGPSILVDYGREIYGGIRLDLFSVADGESARFRVRLGESASEAEESGSYFERVEMARPGHRVESGPSGFRFLRLDLLEPDNPVELGPPEAFAIERDLPCLGSFACDDERLDRIWAVGVRTVHLCMQETLWDGIKRGRTVWAGDLHPGLNVIAAAFGPHPVVAASFDRLQADSTRRPGPPDWMNDIPGYSLWWVICQAEWFLYAGDRAYLESLRDPIANLMAVVCEGIDADGREQFDGWRFFDWATNRDLDAIHVGYQGMAAWALRSAISLAATLGDFGTESLCARTLARVERYRPPPTSNKQARAMLVLGGLADPEATNREVLAPDPARNLTPFLGYHVLEARARAGDYSGALDLIRGYWGAMIDLGAATFWEDFRETWVDGAGRIDEPVSEGVRDLHGTSSRGFGLSLCHAWSAGPSAWLSRHVLGVEPIEPGCRVVRVRPRLGGLEWAEGRYPTPLGVVEVRHRRRGDGSVESDVAAPEGIEILREV